MHACLLSITNLSKSIFSACHNDLPDFKYPYRKPGQSQDKTVEKSRRPELYDLHSVFLFQQLWGNTACGFPGIAGQAMTYADTVVVVGPSMEHCVYFGGRFAYLILKPNEQFMDDLAAHRLVEQTRGKSRYETQNNSL